MVSSSFSSFHTATLSTSVTSVKSMVSCLEDRREGFSAMPRPYLLAWR